MKKYLQRNIKGTLGAVSGTTTFTSLWQPIDSFEKYMIQIAWTGTPTGTVSLLVSADPIPSLESVSSIDLIAPVVIDEVKDSAISVAGVNVLTYENMATSGNWVALQWVNATGTGTITSVNFVGKGSLV